MEDIKDSSSNIVTADGAINLIITNNIKLKDINISKTIVGESQSLLNQVLQGMVKNLVKEPPPITTTRRVCSKITSIVIISNNNKTNMVEVCSDLE